MKKSLIALSLLASLFIGCATTQDIQFINDEVREDVKNDIRKVNFRLDSLRKVNDSLQIRLNEQDSALAKTNKTLERMKADLTILANRTADESVRNDSRHEELTYRLDMLLGKSDKILAKKVVVSGAPAAPVSLDSIEAQANLLLETEAMFNTARADFLRGEYKIAFDGFKQVFEQLKTGDMAEESLYWMALCLQEAEQPEKAKVLLNRLATEFPDGNKTCVTLFKLAGIAAGEGDFETQKKQLQTLLEKKQCMETNEFIQAAEMLEEILNGETPNAPAAATEKPAEQPTEQVVEQPAAPAEQDSQTPQASVEAQATSAETQAQTAQTPATAPATPAPETAPAATSETVPAAAPEAAPVPAN